MFSSCFCPNRQYFFVYTNGNSWLNSFQLRNFSLYLNSELIDDKQLTRTLNLFRHSYRPVLQILTAILSLFRVFMVIPILDQHLHILAEKLLRIWLL